MFNMAQLSFAQFSDSTTRVAHAESLGEADREEAAGPWSERWPGVGRRCQAALDAGSQQSEDGGRVGAGSIPDGEVVGVQLVELLVPAGLDTHAAAHLAAAREANRELTRTLNQSGPGTPSRSNTR